MLFRVRSYAAYGALGPLGRRHDRRGAVEVAPLQGRPDGFRPVEAVFRAGTRLGQPWGRGRPGWHIECSAMSHELLGASFDIHGGGLDLQFPHHENEIAQSACAHPHGDFARYWLHNEMLQVEGKKMSKSLGNFFTVRDLLDQGIPGEVIRFVFLMTHYRSPMDWTAEKARQAEATLRKWRASTEGIEPSASALPSVTAALADDLNTAGALAALHAAAGAGDWPGLKASAGLLGLLQDGMGAWAEAPVADLSAQAARFADLRVAAMASKDFSAVDAMKAALVAAGVEVRMSKAGVELVPGPGFDPARLAGLQ
ncbi:MAG: class I tRNA ligase family protein [Paracoccaceae bacterium]